MELWGVFDADWSLEEISHSGANELLSSHLGWKYVLLWTSNQSIKGGLLSDPILKKISLGNDWSLTH